MGLFTDWSNTLRVTKGSGVPGEPKYGVRKRRRDAPLSEVAFMKEQGERDGVVPDTGDTPDCHRYTTTEMYV